MRLRSRLLVFAPVGCCVTAGALLASGALEARGAQEPTRPDFSRDVAPIIFEHCVSCHRPGGPAPFSLLTYKDASFRARQIAAVTDQSCDAPMEAGARIRFRLSAHVGSPTSR
jgi:hypothetical protein